ncbi:hypothetical protein M1373_02125, partial [Candidatus Marsarchaeota archaeon]|nr:hypothetical protein [Candidatus Marsarchaeota archaeon]
METSHRKSSLLGDRGYDENIVLHNALRHAERLYSKDGAMPKYDSEAARRIIRQEHDNIKHIAEEMDKRCNSSETAERAELRRAYTDVLIEVLDTALLSDEIGRLKGTHSKLLDLDIKLVDAFIDKPRIARSSIRLLNKVATYSEVLSSTI